MQIYILTREHNDYDQHGEYFVEAFEAAPTFDQLTKLGVPINRVKAVQQGGGRQSDSDNIWHNLRKVNPK